MLLNGLLIQSTILLTLATGQRLSVSWGFAWKADRAENRLMRLPSLPRSVRQPARYGALVAGALPLLAFPGLNLWPLAWFGLVPGLLLIHRAPSAREAAIRGWWLGCGYFVAAMYWLAPEIGPAVLLVAIVFGLLLGPFGMMIWTLLRPPVTVPRALAALVVVPSYWLVTEWIRSWQALGGPWAVLGASQWQHPAVLALASVGGVWLVSFVLVAANVAILIAIVAGRLAARLVSAAALAAVVVAGPVAFALTPPAPVAGTTTIALVQPGVVNNPAPRRTPASGSPPASARTAA